MSSLSRQKQVNNSKTYSNRSSKTNQDSTVVCNACKTSREDMQVQIAQLKDKAHQSFMQVLQIQQLHQEELSQMREQWNQREQGLMAQVASLQEQLKVLKYEMTQLQKNVNRHSYDFGAKDLIIENIELIGCQDNDRSYLDESALIQFKDLLVSKNGSDYVASLKREIYRDIKFVSNNKTQIQKLFMIIKDLKDDNSQLQKNNQGLKQKLAKSDANINQLKSNIDNFNKQNKFICQNLKRLSNDKLKLQKRVSQLERTKIHDQVPSSPGLHKHRSVGFKEDNSDKLNEPILEVSELSILKREINELNYAKFMATDEVQNQNAHPNLYKKKKAFTLQGKESH